MRLIGRGRYIYELEVREHVDIPAYDRYERMVVIADDSKSARQIAAGYAMDEKPETWLKSSRSQIQKIGFARQMNGQHFPKERLVCADGNGA